jgi:pyruvate/2-oxoglutarate dehydrogenase complex dihydrolipoamide acyltransferase (E2) component
VKTPTDPKPRLDVLSWASLLAAIGVTAYSEYQLGVHAGFGSWVAAGIPAALDIYALRAMRAGRDVVAVVTAMITVNALSHLVATGLIHVNVPLVVAVSAIAPLVFWRVHLLAHEPTVALPATKPAAAKPATPAATPRPTVAPAPATPKPASSATSTKPATPAPAPPATPAVATALATDGSRYEPGTPQHVVRALWLQLGHRPTEGAIVTALGEAELPNSRAQAGKIRRQVENENPALPGPRAA